jgi:Flp pilus assembly protein TadG
MNKHPLRCKDPKNTPGRNIWRDKRGEAAVSFGLVLPVLLLLSFGILEFALALMDRQQASEALRLFTRAVAISITSDNLSGINSDSATTCAYNAGSQSVTCANGSDVTNWQTLIAGFNDARAVFPRLTAENIVLIFEPTGLSPDVDDDALMALVTVQFQNLEYEARVFPLYNSLIERILFPTISNSLVLGG